MGRRLFTHQQLSKRSAVRESTQPNCKLNYNSSLTLRCTSQHAVIGGLPATSVTDRYSSNVSIRCAAFYGNKNVADKLHRRSEKMPLLNFILGNECTCVYQCKETHVHACPHTQLEGRSNLYFSSVRYQYWLL